MNLSLLRYGVLVGALILGISGARAQADTLIVNNLNDAGEGSLRQAISDANAQPDADVITFAPELSGTLTLTTGELAITNSVTIQGPTEQAITLSGGNTSRIFFIHGAQTNVSLSHLILTQGVVVGSVGTNGANGTGAQGGAGGSVQGGAILNEGQLRLESLILTGNSLQGGKGGTGGTGRASTMSERGGDGGVGGIAQGSAVYSSGSLQIVDSTFYNNSAVGGNGGIGGIGGAQLYTDGIKSLGGSGGKGGSAQGGAIYSSGLVEISGSTFYSDKAVAGGGGKARQALFLSRPI